MEAKLYDPNLCENFADRVEFIVARAGGPAEFARRLGISAPALMRWRKGEAEPTLSNLVKLAEASGVHVEWLATGQGPILPSEHASTAEVGAHAKALGHEPDTPERSGPPLLVHSQPEKLDSKAMWGCIQAVAMLQQGLGLQPSEVADFAMRMYGIAMASDMEGYEAVQYAVQQIREGIKYRTKQ
ncbi:helix-turn-helix transcriptional regulator [Chitinimonas viridis]|uniref:Helix-turn-helix transcriptional regulator n=1 Tax=Chitinimonas viridis TaxID=664880 RepID=A0ABT8B9G5_9NEIS|nr:helix-turn-helix transcriptional regulator [Chitinimonas viridis]MDN3578674.1 helix-turn-helix transcriptional regulator [Chitinimonas viridis]